MIREEWAGEGEKEQKDIRRGGDGRKSVKGNGGR